MIICRIVSRSKFLQVYIPPVNRGDIDVFMNTAIRVLSWRQNFSKGNTLFH